MSEAGAALDLAPEHWTILREVLARLAPGRAVFAFGSRARGGAKRWSDLDLAVGGEAPAGLALLAELREAFDESDLPFKVDLVDWNALEPAFRDRIGADAVRVQ